MHVFSAAGLLESRDLNLNGKNKAKTVVYIKTSFIVAITSINNSLFIDVFIIQISKKHLVTDLADAVKSSTLWA